MHVRPETWLLSAALALTPAVLDLQPYLAGGTALAAVDPDAEATAVADERYRAGRRALEEGRWQEAIDAFGEVTARAGSTQDGAFYWKAYAEAKLGKKNEAFGSLRALRNRFPESRYLDDAEVLELELRGGEEESLSEDDELKLYALDSLMGAEPERALPLLEKILSKPNPIQLKEKALFVLSQTESPRAAELLLRIARDSSQPELARHAISMIGLSEGPATARSLMEIYRSSTDRETKEQVLGALMVAEAKDEVLALARGEKEGELQRAAIQQLGVMEAVPELRQLYRELTDRTSRETILESLGIAEDVEGLAQAAREKGDDELRIKAIHSLGIVSEERARAVLLELYGSDSKPIKSAVIEALFIQSDATSLLSLFRREKDRELKREILQKIALIDDDEAQDLMQQILED